MTDGLQPSPGHVLAGRYLLEERLGRGGMSTVWRAKDQVLDREVAVKVVAEMEDAEITAERFRRESRATAALNHPNIVTVFDAGVDDGRAFIVMELLPGKTLADELRVRGAFPVEEVRDIALQVSGALNAAHDAGLVHRDIKPGNLARTADGSVKVLDFGITHIIDEGAADGYDPLTATGAVIGTAAYLAPEQARAERVDQRADIYALGCVLFALLSGKPPFQGPTAVSTMMLHATEPVPDLRELRPDVPPDVVAIVTSMLAKKPEDRPQTVDDVRGALLAGSPEELTQFLPTPIDILDLEPLDDATTVVPADAFPSPMRAHPADAAVLAPPAAEVQPARAAVDLPLDEPEELLPLTEEDDDSGRQKWLIGLVLVALLLVGGFAWWILTRDTELTANPVPPTAIPATETETPQAQPEPTDPVTPTLPAEDPLLSVSPDPLAEETLPEEVVEEPVVEEPVASPVVRETPAPVRTTQAPPPRRAPPRPRRRPRATPTMSPARSKPRPIS